MELLAASANWPVITSMVVAPLADGVNVAVYTVELVALKLLIAPPETVMFAAAKLDVGSLEVKVTINVPSLVVAPLATAVPLLLAAVMVMVGASLSYNVAVLLL